MILSINEADECKVCKVTVLQGCCIELCKINELRAS